MASNIKKKIGIVSSISCECGIATYTEHLTNYYPEDEVVIFGNYLDSLSDTKAEIKHPVIRCWHRIDNLKNLYNNIKKSGVQLVHFQHEFGLFQDKEALLSLLINLKKDGIKTVMTFHTIFKKKENNAYLYKYSKYLDYVFTHNENIENSLNIENLKYVPHGSMLVIPKSKCEARKYLNIEDNKIVLLCLGFITINKANIDVIKAVDKLKIDFPNILLKIVGYPVVHGRYYGNLEYCCSLYKKVEELKLFNHVDIVCKFISEKEMDYYAGAADIAVENYMETQYSISGMSHLVMSYGLPSVSSNSLILSDLNEERSLKYNIGDIDTMARHIKYLVKNKDKREVLSTNSLLYAMKTSWPNIANEHLRIYQGIKEKAENDNCQKNLQWGILR